MLSLFKWIDILAQMLDRYRDQNERLEIEAEDRFHEKMEKAKEQKRKELSAAEKGCLMLTPRYHIGN